MNLREDLSEPLHRVAIHCLRELRQADKASGLSSARLSALSVIVFAGPKSPSALAEAEQVSAPTMTKLIQGLTGEGLVTLKQTGSDARKKRVAATAKGKKLMFKARDARLAILEQKLSRLTKTQQRQLAKSMALLQSLF